MRTAQAQGRRASRRRERLGERRPVEPDRAPDRAEASGHEDVEACRRCPTPVARLGRCAAVCEPTPSRGRRRFARRAVARAAARARHWRLSCAGFVGRRLRRCAGRNPRASDPGRKRVSRGPRQGSARKASTPRRRHDPKASRDDRWRACGTAARSKQAERNAATQSAVRGSCAAARRLGNKPARSHSRARGSVRSRRSGLARRP